MIEIQNLNKRFHDNNVLNDLCINIKKGESAVIIGQSGTGKSVMLKCLLGLINPDSGSIKINNKEIFDKNLKYIKKIILMLECYFKVVLSLIVYLYGKI